MKSGSSQESSINEFIAYFTLRLFTLFYNPKPSLQSSRSRVVGSILQKTIVLRPLNRIHFFSQTQSCKYISKRKINDWSHFYNHPHDVTTSFIWQKSTYSSSPLTMFRSIDSSSLTYERISRNISSLNNVAYLYRLQGVIACHGSRTTRASTVYMLVTFVKAVRW